MKTLYIFDFDGTLFKSPEPNPSLWTQQVIGKIKSMPSENGFGWFQDTITLDDPYVPIKPSDDWFNTHVVNDALNAFKDENNIVCLLTGRTILYSNIIDRILESANLKFHHKGLKPLNVPNVARESTFDFKKKFILDLLNNSYKNQIGKVIVYEDRIGHVELFDNFLKSISSITHQTIHVNESPKYLLESEELKLVDYLVKKNVVDHTKAPLKKQVEYSALVLSKESVSKVLSLFELPKDWLVKSHHVTLNLGSYNPKSWRVDETNLISSFSKINLSATTTTTTTTTTSIESESSVNNSDISFSSTSISSSSSTTTTTASTISDPNDYSAIYPIGSTWTVNIEAIGFSENALAVKVQGIPSSNIIPHCTIAIHPNAKASDSNSIKNWYPISHFKAGEKVKLTSYNETELKHYHDLVSKQENLDLSSPSKGKSSPSSKSSKPNPPSQCSVILPLNYIENSSLNLTGTITEVGKLYYDIPKPQKSAKIEPYKLIQNADPELSKDEIIRIIPKVKSWLSTSKLTDINQIQEYLNNNIIGFKTN